MTAWPALSGRGCPAVLATHHPLVHIRTVRQLPGGLVDVLCQEQRLPILQIAARTGGSTTVAALCPCGNQSRRI